MLTAVIALLMLVSSANAAEFPPSGDFTIHLEGIAFVAGAFVVGAAAVWGIRKAFVAFTARR